MKRITLFLLLVTFIVASASGQRETFTLEQCYAMSKSNYPKIKQYDLIRQTEQFNLSNAAKGWLPQLSLSAKATYQSEVTKLPIDFSQLSPSLAGMQIPSLSKDQYQAVAEVNQTLWDGGTISSNRQLTKAQAAAEREQLESDLYTLNERINQLYFGSILQDELLVQNALLQKELQVSIDRVSAMIANGMANQSDRESLEVEMLNARQKAVEITASRKMYRAMLGVMIGKEVSDSVQLEIPQDNEPDFASEINRPELRLFDAQSSMLDAQYKQITAGIMPRAGFFVQGGYGRPGLNMLKNSFEPFFIGGVRLSWNLGKLYTLKNDRRKLEVGRQNIEALRETFLFNTKLQLTQQQTEIAKMNDLVKTDDSIVRLRGNIKQAAEVKLANGVISVSDLIREINAEDMAKQTGATHRIQRLMNIYSYKYTSNK